LPTIDDQTLHVVLARDVGDDRQRLTACRCDLRPERVEPVPASRARHDGGAVAREAQCGRASDAGRCAGDDDNTREGRHFLENSTTEGTDTNGEHGSFPSETVTSGLVSVTSVLELFQFAHAVLPSIT
jgi:hypothetical protein